MSELMKIIISLSLSGTLFILLLFLFRPLYGGRLSKRWQYYIWLIAIARLLLPVTMPANLMGGLFHSMEQNTGWIEHIGKPDVMTEESETSNGSQANDNYNEIVPETPKDSSPNDFAASDAPKKDNIAMIQNPVLANAARTISTLWLTIALLLFVRKVTVYQSFVKYIRAGSKPVDDIALLECFGQILSKNRIRKHVELSVNRLASSPLLIGFLHPHIVLPDADLPADDFYYTILHELTHYKRRDMYYKWLVQLTICLHWFNPFVYRMEKEIRRLCELSCDERVIASLSENARKSYGDTLINAIGIGGAYKDSLASVTLNESKKLLKGRLDAIMKYKSKSTAAKIASFIAAFLLISGAVFLGSYTAHGSYVGTDGAQYSASPDSPDGIMTQANDNDCRAESSTEDNKPPVQPNHETDPNPSGASRILNGDGKFSYVQSSYCKQPYIIELGWNLPEKSQEAYESIQVTLADNSTIPVFFDASCKDSMSDSEVVSSIATLLTDLSANDDGIYQRLPIKTPFIVNLEYIGNADLNLLADNYYEQKKLTYFSAVFPELDLRTQQAYLEQQFNEDNIDFFVCSIGVLEGKDYFLETIERYLSKSYQEDEMDYFAVLAGFLEDYDPDSPIKDEWIRRCRQDGRTDYLYLLDDFPAQDDDSDDSLSKEEDEYYLSDYLEDQGLLEEYSEYGIIPVKNDYYYSGKRIRLLVDTRSDGSFQNFNYNKRGTVDVGILRDKDGAITNVYFLDKKTAEEILGEIDDAADMPYCAYPLAETVEEALY